MGKSAFVKHMNLPHQLYATILTSTCARININSIDFSKVAVKLMNPFSKVTLLIGDEFLDYCMDVSKVRRVGELVVAVVEEDPYLSYYTLLLMLRHLRLMYMLSAVDSNVTWREMCYYGDLQHVLCVEDVTSRCMELNVRRALQIVDKICVLTSCRMVFEGPPQALTGNEELATKDLKTMNKL